MLAKTISLRVDVDTAVGLKKGVPNLLDIFRAHGVPVTFFIVMGPDSMGRHVFRFKKKGYTRRILRINPFRLVARYGLRPFLYGTLIRKPPLVAASAPAVIGRILSAGHEIGLHSYNHAYWADHFENLTPEEIHEEFKKAISQYQAIIGSTPLSSACPNWRCTEKILWEEDKYDFLYLSDLRGQFPFFPLTEKGLMNTIQIPQTLPTFHECLQAGMCSKNEMVDYMVQSELKHDQLNVFTLHDWSEGMSYPDAAYDFIAGAKAKGFRFESLSTCARELLERRSNVPACRISLRAIPGGIGKVASQEIN